MLELVPGWQLDAERAGDWLVVRVRCPDHSYPETPPVAEWVWSLAQQHGTSHVILQMDEVPILFSYLIGQLVLLLKRATVAGGHLRICGLSENNLMALRVCRLDDRFPCFATRDDAIHGRFEPRQPR